MNSLSWLIYLAGVVNTIIGWFFFTGILGGIGCIITFVWWLVIGFNPKDTDIQDSIPLFNRWRWLFVPMFFISLVFSIALPDKQTIILIAGSQVGERIVQSESVKGVVDPGLDLLKTWIDRQKAELLAPKKEK